MSKLVKFVEEMCSVFNEGCCFVNQRLKIVVDQLRNAFCGVAVAGNNGASWIALLVNFK